MSVNHISITGADVAGTDGMRGRPCCSGRVLQQAASAASGGYGRLCVGKVGRAAVAAGGVAGGSVSGRLLGEDAYFFYVAFPEFE